MYFRHTVKWLSYTCTYIYSFLNSFSHIGYYTVLSRVLCYIVAPCWLCWLSIFNTVVCVCQSQTSNYSSFQSFVHISLEKHNIASLLVNILSLKSLVLLCFKKCKILVIPPVMNICVTKSKFMPCCTVCALLLCQLTFNTTKLYLGDNVHISN